MTNIYIFVLIFTLFCNFVHNASASTVVMDGLSEKASSSCMTFTSPKINEFQPNPPGSDPAFTTIEFRGTPGADFSGWLFLIDSDGTNVAGAINSFEFVSGIFDSNGLLSVVIQDLKNPSFTLVLANSFSFSSDVDSNNDGNVDNLSGFGTVYDAIGVPDSKSDENFLYGAQLGGTDFEFTGDEPQLIFRDWCTGDLYAVNDPSGNVVYDVNGMTVAVGSFDMNPLSTTFGSTNPKRT